MLHLIHDVEPEPWKRKAHHEHIAYERRLQAIRRIPTWPRGGLPENTIPIPVVADGHGRHTANTGLTDARCPDAVWARVAGFVHCDACLSVSWTIYRIKTPIHASVYKIWCPNCKRTLPGAIGGLVEDQASRFRRGVRRGFR